MRKASFASVQAVIGPVPWLVDGAEVFVRPLFPTGDDATLAEACHLDGAPLSETDGAACASPDSLPPTAAAEPIAAVSQFPNAAEAPAPSVPAPSAPASDPHAEAFARAVVEHITARTRALAAVEEQLLELAVQLAEVLVEREIARSPEIHATLVRAALAALEGNQASVVRASHAAYTAIVDAFGDPLIEVDGTQVRIVLDARLEGLGVVVESPDSRVDGRVGERLRSALRAMQDERRRREAEVAA